MPPRRAAQRFVEELWEKHNGAHRNDRAALFRAVKDAFGDVRRVLYPGSYIDLHASTAFAHVTYVDIDNKAKRFFANSAPVEALVERLCAEHSEPCGAFEFFSADYCSPLPVRDASCDLLVSMYAGPISEYCTRYVRPNGLLLVNASHGDAALARLSDQWKLEAVVLPRDNEYFVESDNCETFMIPKRADDERKCTRTVLLRTQKGFAYTKSAAAYVFRKREGDALGGDATAANDEQEPDDNAVPSRRRACAKAKRAAGTPAAKRARR